MFRCFDYVVGEIVEAYDKTILLEEINERFINYNSNSKKGFVRCLCVKGVYYIAMM